MAETDEELVQRARAGDHEAFGALVDRYRDMVYGLGYHLAGDFEAARDLAQETFVRAYMGLGSLREPDRLSAWLRGIAENVYRAQVRRKEVSTVVLDEQATKAPARDRIPSAIELTVREALDRLRPPERLTLTLHYINGYSHAEIGAFLGVRSDTVKTRLARARQSLREELLQMAEDMFHDHPLPPEFRQDVIGAVTRLVEGFRAKLPDNVRQLRDTIRSDGDRKLSVARSALVVLLGPLPSEEGEIRQVLVADLPADVRQQLRDSLCYVWVDWVLMQICDSVPWIPDPDGLWIRFYKAGGKFCLRLTSAPGKYAPTHNLVIDADDPEAQPAEEPEAQQTGEVLAGSSLPEELRRMFEPLRQAVPGKPGALRPAFYAEMAGLMREVQNSLPAEAKAKMASGEGVGAASLPEPLRQLLKKALAFHWGFCVLHAVENVPGWVTDFEDSKVEFGLFPSDARVEVPVGKPYVKVYGPDGERSVLYMTIPDSDED